MMKIGAQLGAVEEVIDLGKRYKGIVAVKVVSCEKHPNADKLSLCFVDDGGVIEGVERNERDLVQVVCGAPNVKAGMLAAWIPPGVTVPATYDKDPFVLEV
jgi:phenylalanyl-tRNA synthetase beta chain